MNSLIQRTTILPVLIGLALACFGLSPEIQAVNPAPDGCYPNFTTAEGCDALSFLTTGAGNTGLGWRSLFLDTTGNFNTAVGGGALALNNADSNTAVGVGAMLLNTTGVENVAVGTDALVNNDSGSSNNAVGAFALFNNIDGLSNNAFGDSALFGNIHANNNTAIGDFALSNNDNTGLGLGSNNTAVGASALFFNTDGTSDTAVGYEALSSNTTGDDNTAIGDGALLNNTTGDFNTANGFQALRANSGGSDNTADGTGALDSNTTGSGNTALGVNAGSNVTTANNVICIGSFGADVSDTAWIGHVYGVTTQSGATAPVVVSDGGQLGTVASSERFKKDIATMEKASEVILSLRPVTFHYKTDTEGTPQFGLIAEEVAKVNPALVLPDKEGKPYTVRYDAVNAMLLNEFLKEHRKNEEQQATITELKSTVAQQQKGFEAKLAKQEEQIEALTAGLQKVSAQLELKKLAPQTVKNND
jgi:Chaperone of endosialidase